VEEIPDLFIEPVDVYPPIVGIIVSSPGANARGIPVILPASLV
jgi:hypothetical protein